MTSNFFQTSRRSVIAAAALSATLLGGAAFAQGKVLTMGGPFPPQSMDPALGGNGRAGMHFTPAYEPLYRTQADGKFAPALATAWTLSPDSKVATFTIRDGAKFSDGEPVTAAAVKKSIEYFRSKRGPFTVNLRNVTAIDVVDGNKVRITMSQPQPNMLNLFDINWNVGYIISPKAVDNPDSMGKASGGAGAYKLDTAATITGKKYVYVPNEFYYDKSRQKWDRVEFSVFTDMNAGIAAVKAGQLKFLASDAFSANQNAAALADKNIQLVTDPMQWTGLILLDRDGIIQKELKDVRVRQAINYALDRKALATALYGKLGSASTQLQGPGFMGYDPKLEQRYAYNPAKAKELLAAAGLKDGFELKVNYVNNTLSVYTMQAVQQQLRKIGITVRPTELSGFGALNAAAAQKQIGALIFTTNFGVPNLAKNQTLEPSGSLNYYGSTDETLTKLLAEASVLPLDKAEGAWQKVYGHVVELAWFAPVAAINATYITTKDIKAPRIGQSIVIDAMDVVPAN